MHQWSQFRRSGQGTKNITVHLGKSLLPHLLCKICTLRSSQKLRLCNGDIRNSCAQEPGVGRFLGGRKDQFAILNSRSPRFMRVGFVAKKICSESIHAILHQRRVSLSRVPPWQQLWKSVQKPTTFSRYLLAKDIAQYKLFFGFSTTTQTPKAWANKTMVEMASYNWLANSVFSLSVR